MTKVRILPEILSNQIAAGEVVERPFSVVKELVENSLDAGSTQIHIELENGGKNLIRVSDNGAGMSRDDVLLSIERYATSKLYENSDLFTIKTLGFRGEALPSIASVSRFSLVSRNKDSDSATFIHMEGGKIKKVAEAGAPKGTMISVEQLFFNTPARRKFMKTTATEMAHILDTLSCIALGWPDVQFRVDHNGKMVKSWPPASDFYNRAVDILGLEFRNSLISIDEKDDSYSVTGLISSPDVTRSGSQKLYIFINGRYVRDRSLVHALLDAYGSRLMKHRYPVAVLFIRLPYDHVDVNVHPTKHEVRFSDHGRIFSLVRNAVEKNLIQREKKFHREQKNSISEADAQTFNISDKIDYREKVQTVFFERKEPSIFSAPVNENKRQYGSFSSKDENRSVPSEDFSYESSDRFSVTESTAHENEKSETVHSENTVENKSFFSSLKIVGQIHASYILCESYDGLIIIDQHAAHERIVFESIKKGKGHVASQVLLIPETVELGFREAEALEKALPGLLDSGLEIEPFGQNCFAVKAVPALLSEDSVVRLVTDIAEKLVETGTSKILEHALDECLIVMACHGSIRANQLLSTAQVKQMLSQLDECETPSFCPHGRPTWIRYSISSLEKSFRRS